MSFYKKPWRTISHAKALDVEDDLEVWKLGKQAVTSSDSINYH